MGHFPVGNPLAAGTFLLFTYSSGLGFFHAVGDTFCRADRNVWLHTALPQGIVAIEVRRINSAPDTVLVVTHVAVSHDDGLDVGIDEVRVPAVGIGDAVDVIPAAGVEADEMQAECGTYFHELEGLLKLFNQNVNLDGPYIEAEIVFESRQQLVPETGFLGSLDFG